MVMRIRVQIFNTLEKTHPPTVPVRRPTHPGQRCLQYYMTERTAFFFLCLNRPGEDSSDSWLDSAALALSLITSHWVEEGDDIGSQSKVRR